MIEESDPKIEITGDRCELQSEEEVVNIEIEKSAEIAVASKEEGNALFRNGNFDGALELYSKAIDYCPEDDKIALVHQ